MKNIAWLILLISLGVVGYVSAGPYLTIQQIKAGIQEQDPEKLESNIDFSALRQNFKDQLNAIMAKKTATDMEDNPFGLLVAGIASKFVDGAVDTLVTPAGMASLMEGNKPNPSDYNKHFDDTKSPKKELFDGARYSFDTLSKCSVYVPTEDGDEIRFVLSRDGINWELVNIQLPLET